MPCTGGCNSRDDVREELNKITRLLCWVMKRKNRADFLRSVENNEELMIWWEEHQEKDRKREAKERAKQQERTERNNALKLLTPKQKKLLGLRDDFI